MNNSILKYLIISLVVVLLFGLFAYQKTEAPTQEEIIINQKEVEFEQFNSNELGISILIPKESEVTHGQKRVKVIYNKQETLATEITDGFSLFINSEKTEGGLNEFVQNKFEERSKNLKPISEPERVNGNRYTFQVENNLRGTQTYEIFSLNGNVITVSYFIVNPNNYDYQAVVNKIINSIEINE